MKLHSLKQTKELLIEIVQSKHKYDDQCEASK